MITLDLDGTLLDCNPVGQTPAVNWKVINALVRRGVKTVAIASNQGGTPFGVQGIRRADGTPYPTPHQFCVRLRCAIAALARAGITVEAVRVSVYHPRAAADAIQRAARKIRADLSGLTSVDWTVYTTAAARKPSPLMLRSVGATEYWGDSDEDEGAAQAAGVPFVRVERFFG